MLRGGLLVMTILVGHVFVYMPTINLTGTGYTTGLDGDITYKGPVYSRYGNPEVTWEVGKKVNVGLDLQLFNSLNLTMDYFHETRTDIFQEERYDSSISGNSRNKGVRKLGSHEESRLRLCGRFQ